MSLETIQLEHVPATHTVHAAFFRGVANAAALHAQLLARNPAFEYAFIDASCVASRLQVLAAVFRALTALLEDGLRTPNVHSEIVASLSPTNNISEAYRRYGIGPSVKDLVVVKVLFPSETSPSPPSADDVWRHLSTHIEGTPVPLTDDEIARSTDWLKVRKYYKLNGVAALNGMRDEKKKTKEMEALILASMALRGL